VRAAAFALLFASATARADVLLGARPELRLGAGYDDNLFLDANPSGPTSPQIHADAIIDVAPRVLGWLIAARHTLTLDADYLERFTPSNGDLRDAVVRLEWRPPTLGPLALAFAGFYEHWESTKFEADTFDLGGGDVAARLSLGERVRLEASYRADARHYPNRIVYPSLDSQVDVDQRARAALSVRAARWLRVEGAYAFLHIGSNQPTVELDRHRGELALLVTPAAWLTVEAGYSFGGQHLPQGASNPTRPRDDLMHTVDVAATGRPRRWLELFARYQLLWSTSSAPEGRYTRSQVIAGVSLRWDVERRFASSSLLAPTVEGTSVTFRHRAPAGRRVAVIGDWSGWAPQPLAPSGSGYEATYTVPPGRHAYTFTVDDTPEEPRDAPGYTPDGFGGRNGVIIIH
jgi:hypothetical protein